MTDDQRRRLDQWAYRATGGRPWILWAAAIALFGALYGSSFVQSRNAEQVAEDAVRSVHELRDVVEQICEPVQNDPTTRKRVRDRDPEAAAMCRRAERGQLPTAPPPSEPQPPTDAQVRAAVEAYFRDHPVRAGRPPRPAQIATAVARYLREHPPKRGKPGKPGPPPTAEQIADAVEAYLTEHPPSPGPPGPSGPAGPAGAQGEPGRPPTAEEIADAVRAYIEEHPLPLCREGTEPQAHQLLTTKGTVDAVVCVRVDKKENGGVEW